MPRLHAAALRLHLQGRSYWEISQELHVGYQLARHLVASSLTRIERRVSAKDRQGGRRAWYRALLALMGQRRNSGFGTAPEDFAAFPRLVPALAGR